MYSCHKAQSMLNETSPSMQTSTHKNRGIKNLKKKEDWMNERRKKRKNHKKTQKERKKVSYRNPVIYICDRTSHEKC